MDAASAAAGSAAGVLADPKTVMGKLKTAATKPSIILATVTLLAAYLLGRFTRRKR
ncbi:hypothetical protein [Nonomuraea wenchangensis]|uniref:hypothetical protein n=1 Tax=Nonomuraea wenchangensis TaxID=568860 RepID=UPI0033C5672E